MVMNIKIFADGADLESMKALAMNPIVEGFTTNPSLCRKAGVTDYREFAKQVIAIVGNKPVSFEVFADDMAGMERQAREIASWGENIYVKVPITNTAGESTAELIERLASSGVKLNVTAILTKEQARIAADALDGSDSIISVFAGRIADTGANPIPTIRYALQHARLDTKVLWASTREVLNVIQAQDNGCNVITCSPDIIKKLDGLGADLAAVSLATVKQFHDDAKGYSL